MNIFILDEKPELAAKYHCDKHVVKMILEHVQMMSTILREENYNECYKPTHKNHPCTKWLKESLDNWMYLLELTYYLNEEYKYRFNKKENHKSYELMITFPTPKLPSKGVTKFAQAMPETYKSKDSVKSYREYYKNEKKDILKYTKRKKPNWI